MSTEGSTGPDTGGEPPSGGAGGALAGQSGVMDPAARITLGEYISALVENLAAADQAAMQRLVEVVSGRRARISVGDESVQVYFRAGELIVEPDSGSPADGTGRTDSETVLDLLAGRLEVTTAVVDGLLEISGDEDSVSRILLAIEILLDSSARNPGLQHLARSYRAGSGIGPGSPAGARPARRSPATAWYPDVISGEEMALLARFGLL